MRSITFFFPYHDVSGVPVLFARLAEFLARDGGVRTTVVDYRDGAMAQILGSSSPVSLQAFEDDRRVAIEPDTTLVMQAILPATIRPELQVPDSTKVLFWTLHPLNLVQAIAPVGWIRNRQAASASFHRFFARTVLRSFTGELRSFVLDLVRKHSLVFMDGTTLDATCERLDVRIDEPVFLPVPSGVDRVERRSAAGRPSPDLLSVGWIGRLCDFKIHMLVHTMQQMAAYAARTRTRIRFHIVGAGPLEHLVDGVRFDPRWFEIVRAGVVPADRIDEYISTHVDVLAAMGQSALEGAKFGIPTILLDIAYAPVPSGYRFRWLFDADRWSLAELMSDREIEPGNDSLTRMMQAVKEDYGALSRRTYDYCASHHSMDEVSVRLLDAVSNASFTWGDMPARLREKSLVRRAYERARAAYRSASHARASGLPRPSGRL